MKKHNNTTASLWEQCKYLFHRSNLYITHHAWLYATITTCIKFFGPIFNFIGWMVIILLTFDFISKGALIGYIMMYSLIGLGAGIFAMVWYGKYTYSKELSLKEQEQWQRIQKFTQKLVDAYFKDKEHTEAEKEAYKQDLLKDVPRPYAH